MSLNPLALSSPFCFAPSKGNYFLFSVSESVSVELYSIYFHIPHINENIYYLSFFVWLISLIIILSRPIHVAANGETSFRFMTEECFIVCVCVQACILLLPYPFIYEGWMSVSTEGHFSCFCILVIINNAAISTGIHISFWISVLVFFRCKPKRRVAGLSGGSIFNSLRKFHDVFHYGCSLHSHQRCTFLHILSNICYLLHFWWWPLKQMWRDILWLWFSFPWWLVMLNIIPWAYCPSVFFRKMPIQAFCILKVRYLLHVSRVKKISLSLSLYTHTQTVGLWFEKYHTIIDIYNYKLIFIMIFITESHTTDESSDDKIHNKHFVMNEY